MDNQSSNHKDRRLIWIYPDYLFNKLNAAPVLEAIAGLKEAGWKVDLLMGGVDGKQEIQGVEVIGIPRPDTFIIKHFIFHQRVMQHIMDRWNPTSIVIFRHVSVPWVLYMRIVRALRGGKGPLFVMDIRTLPMEKTAFKDRLRRQFMYLMNALANRIADGQTTNTRRMAEAYHIPPKKWWGNWPSAVNLDIFAHAAEGRRWPQDNEPVQMVYVGVLTPERDLINLCQAVEKANQEGMCFELTLVGDGPDFPRLSDFAARTNGRVRLLGRVQHDRVPAVLTNMHIGSLPFPDTPEYRASSPIKLFEYLGAGMPIFATRMICHTEVIGDWPCAFWAENSSVESLTEGLRNVWKNRFSLPEAGRKAEELAQQNTWSASVKKFIAALENGLVRNGR